MNMDFFVTGAISDLEKNKEINNYGH